MANTFIHGYKGTVLLGAQNFAVEKFDVEWSVTAEDITHSQAAGAQVMLDGIESIKGTLTFVYDTSNKPTVSPNMMKPRTFAVVHFKPDGTDDFSCNCLFSNFKFSSGPQAGKVEVSVDVMSSGAITYPLS